MSNDATVCNYDKLGRLTNVTFLNGAMVTYNYDAMGNRTTVVETPAVSPPGPPTVAAFPKRQNGDFNNNAMMVLLSTGGLVGWGDNTTGSLVNAIATATSAPTQPVLFDPNTTLPPFDATIVDWAFTNANVYVVFSNGWAYSGGRNELGQLGQGDTINRPFLKRIEFFVTNNLSITKVWACGAHDTTQGGGCVYFQSSDYSMYACGANVAGNLGNASTPTSNVNTPAPCAGIGNTTNHVVAVTVAATAANFSTYMLFNDGTLFVAGYNGQGQLGVGSLANVTGKFVSAKTAAGVDVSNIVSVSANGGYVGSTLGGNALVLDTSGNVWTVGYGIQGTLGLGTVVNKNLFNQVTALSGISKAELGGGVWGYGYALSSTGTLYTWGHNGQNNLFMNTLTTPLPTPAPATALPGPIAKVFFPHHNYLSTNGQLIVLTTDGLLAYAGAGNGQIGIANAAIPGAYFFIPTPRDILDGTDTIADMFVHGSNVNQRWFILTAAGYLYACGRNLSSICTGGVSSNSMAANVEWFKFAFNN